jgi:outer membrane protein assembly factor BamB
MVQGNRLYVMDDYAVTLQVLAASTGKQLWMFAQDEFGPVDLIGATDQVVYAQAQGVLYALQASDGTVLWNQNLQDQDNPGAGVVRRFTLTSTMLYETLGNTLSAFSLKDGSRRWGYTGPAVNNATVAVVGAIDATVYVQNLQTTLALRASDGQQLWQTPGGSESPGMLLGTVIYIAQAIYSGDQPHSGALPSATCRLKVTLSRLNAPTGTVSWNLPYSYPCA